MKQSNATIVPMNAAHIPAVAELERLCFSTPWNEDILSHELVNPLSLWYVAEVGGKVAGYVGSQTVMDEADMMNVAVFPEFRRLGIAKLLLDELENTLAKNGVVTLALEVRVSNEPAIELYKSRGYEQVGRRPRYYFKPTEDALILKKGLMSHENSGN